MLGPSLRVRKKLEYPPPPRAIMVFVIIVFLSPPPPPKKKKKSKFVFKIERTKIDRGGVVAGTKPLNFGDTSSV